MLRTQEYLLIGDDEDGFLDEMEDDQDQELIEGAKAPLRYIWWNRVAKIFTTYCEGDVTIVTYDYIEDEEEYLTTLRAYYKNDQIGRA